MTGEKMYTLEDDKETTSSLRKRKVTKELQGQETAVPAAATSTAPGTMDGSISETQRIALSEQITNSKDSDPSLGASAFKRFRRRDAGAGVAR